MSSPPSSKLSVSRAPECDEKTLDRNTNTVPQSKKGFKFWLIFSSMCICLFLSALELASVSTALPTIANELHAEQFTWVGSAYALSSTAYLPMSGGLAQTFGRRHAMLFTLGLFALGSGICGGAKNINMLIAGRTIQGLGGGGIGSLTMIVLADLVTLKERGLYVGLYGFVWCLAASFAPIVGGSFATHGQWRWLFLGNFLAIASTVAYTLGLTWGGITFPWGSAVVLVPLVLGLVGLGIFIAYEATLAKYPLVPFSVMTNMTSISGYIQTFCSGLTLTAVVYYFPVYFQACKGLSPIVSGIYSLALSSIAFAGVSTGILVKFTKRYRPFMWMGWVITIVALALMSTILAGDSFKKLIGYSILLGCGLGMLHATTMFPVQAPLPVTQNAAALSFMSFLGSFGDVWGITVGSTVLQNELAKRLPMSFLASIPQGTSFAYALIPELSTLPSETLTEVQAAFASSLAVVWRVLAVICSAGLWVSLFMKGIPLHDALDADWALKNEKSGASPERTAVNEPENGF